jgi:hypothetical protein
MTNLLDLKYNFWWIWCNFVYYAIVANFNVIKWYFSADGWPIAENTWSTPLAMSFFWDSWKTWTRNGPQIPYQGKRYYIIHGIWYIRLVLIILMLVLSRPIPVKKILLQNTNKIFVCMLIWLSWMLVYKAIKLRIFLQELFATLPYKKGKIDSHMSI